jgi:hypothetical protein
MDHVSHVDSPTAAMIPFDYEIIHGQRSFRVVRRASPTVTDPRFKVNVDGGAEQVEDCHPRMSIV